MEETPPSKNPFKKIFFTLAGFVLVLAGIVMLVVPGPGIVTILAGMAILAKEYPWAKRILHSITEKGKVLWEKIKFKLKRH